MEIFNVAVLDKTSFLYLYKHKKLWEDFDLSIVEEEVLGWGPVIGKSLFYIWISCQ